MHSAILLTSFSKRWGPKIAVNLLSNLAKLKHSTKLTIRVYVSFPKIMFCNLAANEEKENIPVADLKDLEEAGSPSSAMTQMLGWSLFLLGILAVGAGVACFCKCRLQIK